MSMASVHALLLCLFAAVLPDAGPAPSMTVTPDVLTVGGEATITYSDPGLANQTIIIAIDDMGIPTPRTDFVEIELGADGKGQKKWTVPSWDLAHFVAPDGSENACPIVTPNVAR